MLNHKSFFTAICFIGVLASCHAQLGGAEGTEKRVFVDSYEKQTSDAALLSEKMRSLRAALKAEIATPFANDPSQCAAIAVGSRACGGAESYLVYSRKISNEKKIQELASQYTEADREWNRVSNAISICSMVEPPEIGLVNGVCVAKSNSAFQVQPSTK